MRLSRMLLLSCFALLACLPLAGQVQDGYSVTGAVINEVNREPLAECTVHLIANPEAIPGKLLQDPSYSKDVVSDEQGRFRFDHVPVGAYNLQAERRGFPTRAFEDHDGFSSAVVTGPNIDNQDLVIRLVPPSSIFGYVIDEASEPVRQAPVQLYQESKDASSKFQRMDATMTDDRGRFEFPRLKPGKYYLSVTAKPWYAQNMSSQVSDKLSPATRGLDVTYPTTFFPGVVDPNAADAITVKSGNQSQADIALSPIPALHLRIQIPANSARRPDMYSLHQVSPDGTFSPSTANMHMDDRGGIEFSGLAPGAYEVETSESRVFRPATAPYMALHREVQLSGDTIISGQEGFASQISVVGKLVSASGAAAEGVMIAFESAHTKQMQSVGTSRDGLFSITLPPGAYRVVPETSGGLTYVTQMVAEGAAASGDRIVLKAGQTTVNMVVQVGSGLATVEGYARKGGKAARAVSVALVPVKKSFEANLIRRDQTNTDGSFSLPRVVPGLYRLISVERGWELDWESAEAVQRYLAKGLLVEIKAGDKLQKEVEAQPR